MSTIIRPERYLNTGFAGGQSGNVRITGVDGNRLTVSPAPGLSCKGSKPDMEVRRWAEGINECVGEVTGGSGNSFTIDRSLCGGRSPAPQSGETVYFYCVDNRGSSSSGGGGLNIPLPGKSSGGLSIPTPIIVLVAALVAWVVLE